MMAMESSGFRNSIAALGSAVHALLGERCVACATRGGRDGLCARCRSELPRLPECRCPVCALPTATGTVCGECIRHAPAFDRTIAGALFDYPIDAFVRALKYGHRIELTRALASILADRIRHEPAPDVLVPIPLAGARQRERGFNQSLEIARCLPRSVVARVDASVLARTRDTPAQASLDWDDRWANMRRAFVAGRPVHGLHTAIIDDVMTTGATADAAAGALKKAGAASVHVWVVARAVRRT